MGRSAVEVSPPQAERGGLTDARSFVLPRLDQQIADELHICAGYMSRFMRGVAQQWARRMVAFMRATNSLAPLQWMASQMGCDVVVRSSREARIRELESELQEIRRAA